MRNINIVSAPAEAQGCLRAAQTPKAALYRCVRHVERVRKSLGLSLSCAAYLRLAADMVSGADLAEGRKPVFFMRVDDTAHMLGLSARQVNAIERRLEEIGFIKRETLGNGHRHARRNPRTGELLWSHGIALSPLLRRADELAALATAADDADRAFRAAREKANSARARLKAALASAESGDLTEQGRAILAETPARLTRTAHTMRDLERLAARLTIAAQALEDAKPVDNTLIKNDETVQTSDKAEENDRHEITTSNSYLNSCNASETITPQRLIALAPPRWRAALTEKTELTWTTIGYIADARRKELRIADHAWKEGQGALGKAGAATALMMLDANQSHPTKPVRNVGGAFVAIGRKARAGKADLATSLRFLALRRAQAAP